VKLKRCPSKTLLRRLVTGCFLKNTIAEKNEGNGACQILENEAGGSFVRASKNGRVKAARGGTRL